VSLLPIVALFPSPSPPPLYPLRPSSLRAHSRGVKCPLPCIRSASIAIQPASPLSQAPASPTSALPLRPSLVQNSTATQASRQRHRRRLAPHQPPALRLAAPGIPRAPHRIIHTPTKTLPRTSPPAHVQHPDGYTIPASSLVAEYWACTRGLDPAGRPAPPSWPHHPTRMPPAAPAPRPRRRRRPSRRSASSSAWSTSARAASPRSIAASTSYVIRVERESGRTC
jgi:hypothetical protein